MTKIAQGVSQKLAHLGLDSVGRELDVLRIHHGVEYQILPHPFFGSRSQI